MMEAVCSNTQYKKSENVQILLSLKFIYPVNVTALYMCRGLGDVVFGMLASFAGVAGDPG